MTSAELSAKTGIDDRYLRERLLPQVAASYITYGGKTIEFSLSAGQAFALSTEDSPAYAPGARTIRNIVMAD